MRPSPVENDDNLLTSVTMLHGIGANRQESWDQFYGRYQGVILGTARRMGLDEMSAWDVLQEVMIDFDRVATRFSYDRENRVFLVASQKTAERKTDQPMGGFRQWLFMVVKRKVWKHQKRRRHMTFSELNGDESGRTADIPDTSLSADRLMEEKSERSYRLALLEEALRLLPGITKRSHPRKLVIFLALKLPHVLDDAVAKGSILPEVYHGEINALQKLRARLEQPQLMKEDLMQHYDISSNHVDQEVKAIKEKLQELVVQLAAGKAPD